MSGKALVLTVVGTASVAAAAAGGFIALRMNHADRAVQTVGAPNAPAPAPAVAATSDVQPAPANPAPRTNAPTVARSAEPQAPTQVQTKPSRPPSAAQQPMSSRSIAVEGAPAAQPPVTTAAAAPTSAPVPPPSQPIAPPVVVIPAAAPATSSDATAPSAQPLPDPLPAGVSSSARFEDLVLPADSVIGIRIESTLSSQTARVEDKVVAVVTRDVTVAGRTAIPAGTRLEGNVQSVQPGGKFKNQARLGIRFNRIVMSDNSRVAIQTETIFREGESPANEAVSKVGAGTVVGSILGALIGGKKGAAIGAGAGAAGSTAAVAAGDASNVVIVSGTLLTVRLSSPVTITIERHDDR